MLTLRAPEAAALVPAKRPIQQSDLSIRFRRDVERKGNSRPFVTAVHHQPELPYYLFETCQKANLPLCKEDLQGIISLVLDILNDALNPLSVHRSCRGPWGINVDIFSHEKNSANAYVYSSAKHFTEGTKRVQQAVQLVFNQKSVHDYRIVDRVIIAAHRGFEHLGKEIEIHAKMCSEKTFGQILNVFPSESCERNTIGFYKKHFLGDAPTFLSLLSKVDKTFALSLLPGIFFSLIEQLYFFHDQGCPLNFDMTNIKYNGIGAYFNMAIECGSVAMEDRYRPPEAREREFDRTCAADVWALGCIFHRFLWGREPTWAVLTKMIDCLERSKTLMPSPFGFGSEFDTEEKECEGTTLDQKWPTYFDNFTDKVKLHMDTADLQMDPLLDEIEHIMSLDYSHIHNCHSTISAMDRLIEMIKLWRNRFEMLPTKISDTPNNIENLLTEIIIGMLAHDPTKRITAKELWERYCPGLKRLVDEVKQKMNQDIVRQYESCEFKASGKPALSAQFFDCVTENVRRLRIYQQPKFAFREIQGMQFQLLQNNEGAVRLYFDITNERIQGASKECVIQYGLEFPRVGPTRGFLAAGLSVMPKENFKEKRKFHVREIEVQKYLSQTSSGKYFCKVYDDYHDESLSIQKQEYCLKSLLDYLRMGHFNGLNHKEVRQRQLQFAYSILEQLSTLSEARIVHADLTFSNILVASSETHLKLTDFGSMNTGLTSLHVHSPERCHDKFVKNMDTIAAPKDDLWAGGILLIQLLLGHNYPRWRKLLDALYYINNYINKVKKFEKLPAEEKKAENKASATEPPHLRLNSLYQELKKFNPSYIAHLNLITEQDNLFFNTINTCINILSKENLPVGNEKGAKEMLVFIKELSHYLQNTILLVFQELEKIVKTPLDPTQYDPPELLLRQMAYAMLNPDPTQRPGIVALKETFGARLTELINDYSPAAAAAALP